MLLSTLVLSTLVSTIIASPIVPSHGGSQFYNKRAASGWDYETQKIRGVNLGGWFVLEPFINPSLFEAISDDESKVPVDEYHYTKALGKDLAKERLENHWSSWITESDFESIKGAGLNFVRIPIGYWAFHLLDDDPYVQGQEAYLDKALEWAKKHDLKAWVDLHGAPGSQNGFDNSGLRDSWEFQNGDNTQITLDVLQHIFDKYGGDNYTDTIIGIELLNEPLGSVLSMDKLDDFWSKGYKGLRDTGSVQNVIIHDAFQNYTYFDNKFKTPDYWNVVIDHHHYQVFSGAENKLSIDDHVKLACSWGEDSTKEPHWNLCAEWSAALTDCQKWLNGVGIGARYDGSFNKDPSENANIGTCAGSQDITQWTEEKKDNYRKYIEAQLDAFEKRGGWVYWTWKTETSLEWDFQKLFYNEIFPVPVTDRKFPGQCS
ncbi:Glucan 1,3-beta-glucosidase 2 [Wickerhamomyces ciferrii]|uniref:glucan 1,3-beta-glucosidase n=1 Tax=Wickerhamomyces ciferrii (strain ATCC 14091 / BCRC 22168 / CBS 111 / JCM 3599 / NBRC 0793 / NRRL Y-1031 F-60-10) TaxID=1206466 RepID=K0KI63_WICCF|nr:Glucan 1,3-beta-glucosidase 2 [Wickerhamomyces ciferrii]CCH44900.1 Glucan 1,3-beta-glucosidase 2 [Wickerhamomyces ciferrii]